MCFPPCKGVYKEPWIFFTGPSPDAPMTVVGVNDEKIDIKVNIYKKHEGLNFNESFKLNILLLSLYNLLKMKDEFVYLSKLKDDSFCSNSHPFIEIENKKITHDKINSLLEVSEIKS